MSTDAVHIYLYYFLCAFGFSLSVPFIYIVIVKSPATLKVYRNTILNLTFWYLASMFAVVMLQPVHAMYGTKSCARFVGLVSLFDFEAHVAVIFCVGVSCENVAVAICVCFFYRYAQLRRMNMAASGSSFGLRLCLIGHIVGSIAMGSLGYVLVTYAEWKKVDGVYAMCFDDSNYFVIIRIAVEYPEQGMAAPNFGQSLRGGLAPRGAPIPRAMLPVRASAPFGHPGPDTNGVLPTQAPNFGQSFRGGPAPRGAPTPRAMPPLRTGAPFGHPVPDTNGVLPTQVPNPAPEQEMAAPNFGQSVRGGLASRGAPTPRAMPPLRTGAPFGHPVPDTNGVLPTQVPNPAPVLSGTPSAHPVPDSNGVPPTQAPNFGQSLRGGPAPRGAPTLRAMPPLRTGAPSGHPVPDTNGIPPTQAPNPVPEQEMAAPSFRQSVRGGLASRGAPTPRAMPPLRTGAHFGHPVPDTNGVLPTQVPNPAPEQEMAAPNFGQSVRGGLASRGAPTPRAMPPVLSGTPSGHPVPGTNGVPPTQAPNFGQSLRGGPAPRGAPTPHAMPPLRTGAPSGHPVPDTNGVLPTQVPNPDPEQEMAAPNFGQSVRGGLASRGAPAPRGTFPVRAGAPFGHPVPDTNEVPPTQATNPAPEQEMAAPKFAQSVRGGLASRGAPTPRAMPPLRTGAPFGHPVPDTNGVLPTQVPNPAPEQEMAAPNFGQSVRGGLASRGAPTPRAMPPVLSGTPSGHPVPGTNGVPPTQAPNFGQSLRGGPAPRGAPTPHAMPPLRTGAPSGHPVPDTNGVLPTQVPNPDPEQEMAAPNFGQSVRGGLASRGAPAPRGTFPVRAGAPFGHPVPDTNEVPPTQATNPAPEQEMAAPKFAQSVRGGLASRGAPTPRAMPPLRTGAPFGHPVPDTNGVLPTQVPNPAPEQEMAAPNFGQSVRGGLASRGAPTPRAMPPVLSGTPSGHPVPGTNGVPPTQAPNFGQSLRGGPAPRGAPTPHAMPPLRTGAPSGHPVPNDSEGANTDAERPPPPRYVPNARHVDVLFAEDVKEVTSGTQFLPDEDVVVKGANEGAHAIYRTWEECGFPQQLYENVTARSKYASPRKIQAVVMPLIDMGLDLLGHAETGCGKTAAFVLPLLKKMMKEPKADDLTRCCPVAIVIAPTRELVLQLSEQARKFADGTRISVAKAYGMYSVHENIREIRTGCDILCATPGRLKHFINEGQVRFTNMKYFILDEVDHLLETNFWEDILEIIRSPGFPKTEARQTLLFSATFSEKVQDLANTILRPSPLHVVVSSKEPSLHACPKIKQSFTPVERCNKNDKIYEVLSEELKKEKERLTILGGDGSVAHVPRTLIFVEQKRTSDLVATYLSRKGIAATSINGDRTQELREKSLAEFRQEKCHVLVATDVCARGIDIHDLEFVINYDLPKDITTYIHRIGRTGRLFAGKALSFVDPMNEAEELCKDLVAVVRGTQQELPQFLVDLSEGKHPEPESSVVTQGDTKNLNPEW
ncbi:hypothetical protein QR680_016284 [Steinernema hermaphroditum]|uniref:RNA helicase n=1 Tax=Steinernema hermaphroditum TaxID=289476 RepID=A0AA39LM70_9BILA|nr:hypothetical protein QR680_016284 [Steinernema hermaphroditum]